MRSPSSYPGRASAYATCAWRHLSRDGVREPAIPRSSDVPPSLPRAAPARSCRTRRCSSVARASEVAKLLALLDQRAPALHASRSLDPSDRSDEMRTRHVVGRRERLSAWVVRQLLGDSGQAERAANGDPAERARRSPELPGDDRSVVHGSRLGVCASPRESAPLRDGARSPSFEPCATRGCPSRRRGARPASRS